MIRRSIVAIFSVIIGVQVWAQDKVLSIYYISHSTTTNEKALLNSLELAKPMDGSESAVFYLANSERPYIVYVNLPFTGDSFEDIKNEINTKSSHEVYPEVDCEKLCEVFDNIDKVRADYGVVNLNYYIDSMFWEFYRLPVIAKMYYVLDLADNPDYLTMNIYFTEGDVPEIDEKDPFGAYDLCEGYVFLPLTLYE